MAPHAPAPGRGGAPSAPHRGAPAPKKADEVAVPAVARWARRFRRLAAVAAFPPGEPEWTTLRHVEEARHGGIGIPRSALSKLGAGDKARVQEKPFLVLDHPDAGLARLSRVSGPRAPHHLVDAAIHALGHGAPLILTNAKDALAIGPLVTHAVAIQGPSVSPLVRAELDPVLRGATSAVQDSYGQLEKAGGALLDLVNERARERTLSGLLMRLTRARKGWASRDAARRFRRLGDAAEQDAISRGHAKGEADLLTSLHPIAVGYVDLLPLFLTRLGPGGDLATAFESPLALLALGLVPCIFVPPPPEREPRRDDRAREEHGGED